MDKLIWGIVILFLAGTILCYAIFGFGIIKGCQYVSEHGLENVVERIWKGDK